MKTKYNNAIRIFSGMACAALLSAGCTKADLDDDFTKGDPPPIGAYTNSNEIAPGDLVAYFPFEGNATDVKGAATNPVMKGSGSFVAGKKGLAYQGATDAWIEYASPGALGSLTSFTVSMWINTNKHDGGAQGVWAVAKQDGSFWGNFFMLIESAGPNDNMLAKVHFEKNGVPNVEHWLETTGKIRSDFMRDMYGAWRHVAFTYNEVTSKFFMYVNGTKLPFNDNTITPPRTDEDRFASGSAPNGTRLGPLSFKSATRFVIGAYQNQLGAPFNNPEPWMLPYTGKLDELRFYKRALNDQEVEALFQLEKQGR
ncbi:MAG TPA: LamG domain-containing protein [Chitinophagaceae bacterium]|nr:LamG domain-containing protein [Chitinophagaceae bacterium]